MIEVRKMKLTRRQAFGLIGPAVPAMFSHRALAQAPVRPFKGTRESLKSYVIPDWFADAKFGIWSHWGPQSAIGNGDWYARNMYVEGEPQYEYHRKRFGPQSKVGYKDLISLFTADKWDPEHLMDLYAKAGAKYFFSMAVHHDNFDLWDSKYQRRWNSVSAGPRKNIVGMWEIAARSRGLRFGVSEHLSNSFDWFAPAHLSDTKGPFAGIPYDGANAAYADLYHSYDDQPADFVKTAKPMGRVAPERWKKQYRLRIQDLIQQHQPDLIYSDGYIEFEEYALANIAQLYNSAPFSYGGRSEGVYFSKLEKDCAVGTCVLDRERDVADKIRETPWQTDTCIGEWHYKDGVQYKTAKKVIDLLVDIVSKNGNLLLNFPLPASGELDRDELHTLQGITEWMKLNSEGIYNTRPWKVYGEGPSMSAVIPSGDYNESRKPDLTAEDVRYTSRGSTLYAFVQGWPKKTVRLKSISSHITNELPPILDVRLLGRNAPLPYTHGADGLLVHLPDAPPSTSDIGIALRIRFA